METIEGKKIIVIGGAGFIGSHLCEFLCKENLFFLSTITCLVQKIITSTG